MTRTRVRFRLYWNESSVIGSLAIVTLAIGMSACHSGSKSAPSESSSSTKTSSSNETPSTGADPSSTPGNGPSTSLAPEFEDLEGNRVTPLAFDNDQVASVLVFITTDCPIANAFQPELKRLHEAYAPRGVRFWMVHVDPDLEPQSAREHADEYGIRSPFVLDPDHVLVEKAEATITPEAAVFLSDGSIAYRGRISDLFADLGERRREARNHDLRDALDAVVSGRPLTVARTEAIGCFIPE